VDLFYDHLYGYSVTMTGNFTPTPRTEVRRLPKRGVYDKSEVYAILDEGYVCHVGFALDGQPYVIPTGYARLGDEILIHGSAASRMLRALGDGVDVCVTVTLVDGFVLSRSAFHHSMNYRSVVMLGRARVLVDPMEKMIALRRFTNHILPGRFEEVRPPSDSELKGTMVLALPLEEVSAKIRKGPPVEDEGDIDRPVWAGVVPLRSQLGTPVPMDDLVPGVQEIDRARFTRFQQLSEAAKIAPTM
jgi:nitroimidazol reductase NimA-like FMN-containing flavoprotein (pyridoxamine 5'-phosphate oxidase superfamily)